MWAGQVSGGRPRGFCAASRTALVTPAFAPADPQPQGLDAPLRGLRALAALPQRRASPSGTSRSAPEAPGFPAELFATRLRLPRLDDGERERDVVRVCQFDWARDATCTKLLHDRMDRGIRGQCSRDEVLDRLPRQRDRPRRRPHTNAVDRCSSLRMFSRLNVSARKPTSEIPVGTIRRRRKKTPKAGATGRKTFESAKAQKRLELATNRWPDATTSNVT